MLKLISSIQNKPILSLRTGTPIAMSDEIILDPNTLKIEGWYAIDRFDKSKLILASTDVREIIDKGIVINDHEVLCQPDELVRIKDTIELGFRLISKLVTTNSGKKYGKVNDFAIETEGLFVKKIYVSQSLVKSLSGGSLSIDRDQIIEITNRRIIIEEPTEKSKISTTATAPAS